jgi:glycosyltransferase involved in cell wall biosynthesis
VTVILCTRNRAGRLARSLSYYKKIRTAAPWELVVVHNGSTDETAAILKREVAGAALPL